MRKNKKKQNPTSAKNTEALKALKDLKCSQASKSSNICEYQVQASKEPDPVIWKSFTTAHAPLDADAKERVKKALELL